MPHCNNASEAMRAMSVGDGRQTKELLLLLAFLPVVVMPMVENLFDFFMHDMKVRILFVCSTHVAILARARTKKKRHATHYTHDKNSYMKQI